MTVRVEVSGTKLWLRTMTAAVDLLQAVESDPGACPLDVVLAAESMRAVLDDAQEEE